MEKLDLILERMNDLDRRLSDVERNVARMDSHIDFVEGVYDVVKYPFHSVMGMISGTRGEEQKLLEQRHKERKDLKMIDFNNEQ